MRALAPRPSASDGHDHTAHHDAATFGRLAEDLAQGLGLPLFGLPQGIDRAHAIDQAARAPDGLAGLLPEPRVARGIQAKRRARRSSEPL